MSDVLDQMDSVIDRKLAEVLDLLKARNTFASALGDAPRLVEGTQQLLLGSGEERELPAPSLPPPETPPAPAEDRRDLIAERARVNVAKPQPGKRRHFSTTFKQEVLREVDECIAKGGVAGHVLEKYELYPSHLITWRKQLGANTPRAGSPEAAPLERARSEGALPLNAGGFFVPRSAQRVTPTPVEDEPGGEDKDEDEDEDEDRQDAEAGVGRPFPRSSSRSRASISPSSSP